MLFSSLTFLFIFLPLVLAGYHLLPRRFRNDLLLAASLLFYSWGEPLYLAVLFAVIFSNYAGALLIERTRGRGRHPLVLAGVILLNLGFLIHYKYSDFLAANLNAVLGTNFHFLGIVMPIGISFYTFQAVSYLVDVYRRQVPAQRDVYQLALYIALFPQLVAGPIVKYHDIAAQLRERVETGSDKIHGLQRFILGLAKKVLLANALGEVADKIFAMPPETLAVSHAWGGALFYALQLYFDFSGYSDMAIGLCRVFGFHIPENFNYPYTATSITEFWRRWHISLSTWFKEYLYIPLGGNRVSRGRMYFNLGLVFLATGLWHGAQWSFIAWGLYHGLFIVLEKLTGWNREPVGWRKRVRHAYLLLVVLVGWVFFRSDHLGYAGNYLRVMFGLLDPIPQYGWPFFVQHWNLLAFGAAAVAASGVFRNILNAFPGNRLSPWLLNLWLLGLFYLSFLTLAGSTYNPFIYFRF
jgi:alginate O-acetyltransferase complex protein AlgI